MSKKKCFLSAVLAVLCSTVAWSAEGDTFTATAHDENWSETYTLTFQVISESAKTCRVGFTTDDVSNYGPTAFNGGFGNTEYHGFGTGKSIVIPYYAGDYRVVEIGTGAFALTSFSSITIPESVNTIAAEAFGGTTIKSIAIPQSVTTIATNAFIVCGLEKLAVKWEKPIADLNLDNIFTYSTADGMDMVSAVSNITLYVPAGCKTVYETANGWRDFKEIVEQTLSVGETFTAKTAEGVDMLFRVINEFKECQVGYGYYDRIGISKDYQGSITIPSEVNGFTVSRIGDSAFEGCSGLTGVSIPNTVTAIEDVAFGSCTSLSAITIPASVTSIIPRALSTMANLAIVVEQGNPVYDSRDNCNGIIETAKNRLIRGSGLTVIPSSVTTIGEQAFDNSLDLTSITIPEGVKKIEGWAFFNCNNLKRVKLPSTLTLIESNAFGYITLDEVTVEATTPPTLLNTTSIIGTVYIIGTTLYVPAGSKAAYEADENWKSSFKEIVEYKQPTKFAVEQGKTYTSGQRFDFDNISLTIGEAGGADFDRYAEDGCYVDNNVNGSNAGGSFYVFEPKEDGILAVDVRLNNWKTLQVLEDGEPLEGISGKAFADIFMGNISFPVQAGKTYKVYADGSKLGLGGFTFPSETAELPASLINEEQMFTTDGISYVISSVAKATVDVIGSSNGGEVEIPKTVRMYSEDGSRNFKFTVTGMVEGAFADNRELTSIIIPNTIQFIGAGAFAGCSQLSVVTMRTAEPLNIPDDVFSNRADMLLLVPGASMDAYKAASAWKEFKKILPTGTAYFVVEKGATYQSGQRIETDKIVLTMGEEGGSAFDIYENGYVRNQTDGSSEGGSFYVFEPKTDGILAVDVRLNAMKQLYVLEDGVPMDGFNGYMTSEKFTSEIGFPVQAGKTYKVYASGSKLGFKKFVFPVDETPVMPAAVEQANALYAEAQTAGLGRTFTMDINLKNEQPVRGVSFSLQLPEGVTIAKDDNGEFLANISGRHTDFVYPQVNYDAESGQYNFATISALTGNDGPVWTLTLQVSDEMAVGDYTINLNKISLTLENYETVNVSSSMSRLTIVEKIYRKGDVNDDDDVDIADLVCVVNHVVGIETPVFLEPAADVTDNGKVDISDAVKILDYIVGDIDALAPAANFNLQAMAPVRRAVAQQPQDTATEGDAVYAGAVKVMPGEQAPLTISLKNSQTTCGYQFDLILPAGITLAATDGKYNCVLSDRHNGHTVTVKYLAESNTYRVVVASFASKELTGSDGVVCTLTLQASADMAQGSYTAGIQSGKYSLTSGAASVALPRAEVALTVGNETKGDVNGDGSVNTKDIVSVVGYIMGNTPDGFNAAAADVNGDGVVNIADVVALVNIAAGK